MSKDFEEYTVKVFPDGGKVWCQNGLRHRLDGPAVEYADGDKLWLQNGHLHRLDGPAAEYADGAKAWYIEGKEYTETDFNNKIKAVL